MRGERGGGGGGSYLPFGGEGCTFATVPSRDLTFEYGVTGWLHTL